MRRPVRLSALLPALALLLGALMLFASAPASAQSDPTMPQNVQMTAGDASLTLTWQAPSNWGVTAQSATRSYSIQTQEGSGTPKSSAGAAHSEKSKEIPAR